MRELLRDTRRATAAVLAGTGLGMIARVARAASVARPRPVTRPSTAIDGTTMDLTHGWTRLTASLAGTGPMFLQLALIAAAIVAVAAGARALSAWRAERRSATSGPVAQEEGVGAPLRARPALVARLLPPRRPRRVRATSSTRGASPAAVRALAESGVPRAEIARRTGLSQDAVGLALAV